MFTIKMESLKGKCGPRTKETILVLSVRVYNDVANLKVSHLNDSSLGVCKWSSKYALVRVPVV